MRIAVCDDDPTFLKHVASLLRTWGNERPGFSFDCFTNGDALIRGHARATYDVILLDILMPALDGIAVAREIRASDRDVKIVFLTSSADYAVDSYTVKATNYLLKPISPAALIGCLIEIEEEARAADRIISVKGAYSVHHVSIASIEFLEARGKHVAITLVDGEAVESTEPFYALEEKLGLADGFYKCHRSHLVNINHIRTYSANEVIMRSGRRVPISRGCRAAFKNAYFSVMFGGEDGKR